jgi:hypothetical protein
MPGPDVELAALDQQEGQDRIVTDPPHLRPKASASQRAVQIGDRLAFDQNSAADPVIACGERLDLDPRTESLKRSRDAAPSLKHVRHDAGN